LLRQLYAPLQLPAGVLVLSLRVALDDAGGSFKEVLRLNAAEGGAVQALLEHGLRHIPRQINISVVAPGTRRFWHVHPEQNELWCPAWGQLNVGLADLREGSPTWGQRAKVILGPQQALYIPAGVAHGFANVTATVAVLCYAPDRQWEPGGETQEWRVDPRDLPYDFVLPEDI